MEESGGVGRRFETTIAFGVCKAGIQQEHTHTQPLMPAYLDTRAHTIPLTRTHREDFKDIQIHEGGERHNTPRPHLISPAHYSVLHWGRGLLAPCLLHQG